MVRRTKEEALETRNTILDAAEAIFHAQGVSLTSLANVAEAASVTRGAIYWHFKNKSDLLSAMCQRVRAPLEAMVEAMMDERASDPLGQLRATCIFLLQETVHNPHCRKVFDIVFHKCEFVDASDPIMLQHQEWFRQGRTNMERILTNAVAKKQLPPDLNIPVAGIMLRASMDGLISNWLFAPGSFDLAGNAESLVDACIFNLSHAPSLRLESSR